MPRTYRRRHFEDRDFIDFELARVLEAVAFTAAKQRPGDFFRHAEVLDEDGEVTETDLAKAESQARGEIKEARWLINRTSDDQSLSISCSMAVYESGGGYEDLTVKGTDQVEVQGTFSVLLAEMERFLSQRAAGDAEPAAAVEPAATVQAPSAVVSMGVPPPPEEPPTPGGTSLRDQVARLLNHQWVAGIIIGLVVGLVVAILLAIAAVLRA